ncbi:MAG: hypothetical protein R3F49_19450 [Planctomycetota bacterium]
MEPTPESPEGQDRRAAGAFAAAVAGLVGADPDGRIDGALEDLIAADGPRERARAVVATLVAAGAQGAELWQLEGRAGRRLAAAGPAQVQDVAELLAEGPAYSGTVARAGVGRLVLVFEGDQPGTDRRESLEDLAEVLLTLAALFDEERPTGAHDPGPFGPPAPLP